MSGNLSGFDANEVEPQGVFEPIPADWYNVMIVGSEFKPTKNGNGQYLQLEMEVLDGEFEGRKLWDRLNLENPNTTAVEIAQRTLSAVCRAVGVMTPSDSSELHDKPLRIKVSVKPASGGYDPTNEIKGYESIDGVETQEKEKPKAKEKPWAKKKK